MIFKQKLFIPLSWKQKLFIVAGITISGIVIVTISSFTGLTSINNGFEKQNAAVDYERNSLALANNLLKLEYLALILTAEKRTNFISDLKSLQEISASMKNSVNLINDEKIQSFSTELTQSINYYIEERSAWLENRTALGYNSEAGQLKALSESLAGLIEASAPKTEVELMTHTLVEPVLNTLIINQTQYIVAKDIASENNIEKAVSELEQLGLDLVWKGTVINQQLEAYRNNFNNTRQLVINPAI